MMMLVWKVYIITYGWRYFVLLPQKIYPWTQNTDVYSIVGEEITKRNGISAFLAANFLSERIVENLFIYLFYWRGGVV